MKPSALPLKNTLIYKYLWCLLFTSACSYIGYDVFLRKKKTHTLGMLTKHLSCCSSGWTLMMKMERDPANFQGETRAEIFSSYSHIALVSVYLQVIKFKDSWKSFTAKLRVKTSDSVRLLLQNWSWIHFSYLKFLTNSNWTLQILSVLHHWLLSGCLMTYF